MERLLGYLSMVNMWELVMLCFNREFSGVWYRCFLVSVILAAWRWESWRDSVSAETRS